MEIDDGKGFIAVRTNASNIKRHIIASKALPVMFRLNDPTLTNEEEVFSNTIETDVTDRTLQDADVEAPTTMNRVVDDMMEDCLKDVGQAPKEVKFVTFTDQICLIQYFMSYSYQLFITVWDVFRCLCLDFHGTRIQLYRVYQLHHILETITGRMYVKSSNSCRTLIQLQLY